MTRLRFALALGLGALALTPGAVHAQAKKPAAPAAKPPSQAQMQRSVNNFRVMMSGLQSDKIPQPVKNALFLCIYSNPFSKISEGTDKALAAKKANQNDPNMVIGAMAAVCGFKPEMVAAPKK
jgi:hypothetical protein